VQAKQAEIVHHAGRLQDGLLEGLHGRKTETPGLSCVVERGEPTRKSGVLNTGSGRLDSGLSATAYAARCCCARP